MSNVMTAKRTEQSSKKREAKVSRRGPAPDGRQRIVDAARAYFFSHGFRRVTMNDLAAELGISKKTLYVHFPDKMAVLEAVLADKFAGVQAKLEQVTREHTHDFPAALHELLANTQRELDEIKPLFVRDMRQKAPHVFQTIERRRSELIGHFFGKLFVEGQRAGMVRKDIPAKIMIEILLVAVRETVNPAKMEELGLTPRTAFESVVKVILEGVVTKKARKT